MLPQWPRPQGAGPAGPLWSPGFARRLPLTLSNANDDPLLRRERSFPGRFRCFLLLVLGGRGPDAGPDFRRRETAFKQEKAESASDRTRTGDLRRDRPAF